MLQHTPIQPVPERTIVELALDGELHVIVDLIRETAAGGLLDEAALEAAIRCTDHERAARIASTALGLWRSGVRRGS